MTEGDIFNLEVVPFCMPTIEHRSWRDQTTFVKCAKHGSQKAIAHYVRNQFRKDNTFLQAYLACPGCVEEHFSTTEIKEPVEREYPAAGPCEFKEHFSGPACGCSQNTTECEQCGQAVCVEHRSAAICNDCVEVNEALGVHCC